MMHHLFNKYLLFVALSSVVSCQMTSCEPKFDLGETASQTTTGGGDDFIPPDVFPEDPEMVTTKLSMRGLSRKSIAGRMRDIFRPETQTSRTKLNTLIDNYITSRVESFGQPCNRKENELGCSAYGANHANEQVNPLYVPNTISEAYVVRACYEILGHKPLEDFYSTNPNNRYRTPYSASCTHTLYDDSFDPDWIEVTCSEGPCTTYYYNYDHNFPYAYFGEFRFENTQCTGILNAELPLQFLKGALKHVYGAIPEPIVMPDEATIKKAHALFYLENPSNKVLAAYQGIVSEGVAQGASAEEIWRMLFFTTCSSPGWRVQ